MVIESRRAFKSMRVMRVLRVKREKKILEEIRMKISAPLSFIMKWLHSKLSASHVTALRHHVLVSVTDNFIRGI